MRPLQSVRKRVGDFYLCERLTMEWSFRVYDDLDLEGKKTIIAKWHSWGCFEGMDPQKVFGADEKITDEKITELIKKGQNIVALFNLNKSQYISIRAELKKLGDASKEKLKPNEVEKWLIDSGYMTKGKHFKKHSDEPNYKLKMIRIELETVRDELKTWFVRNGYSIPEAFKEKVTIENKIQTKGIIDKSKPKLTIDKLVDNYIEGVLKFKTPKPEFSDLQDLTGIPVSTWNKRWNEAGFLQLLVDKAIKKQRYRGSKKQEKKELFKKLQGVAFNQLITVHQSAAIKSRKTVPYIDNRRQKNNNEELSKTNSDINGLIDEETNRDFGRKKTVETNDED